MGACVAHLGKAGHYTQTDLQILGISLQIPTAASAVWPKACLGECLERISVDQQVTKTISSLSASPRFAVKIWQAQSDWYVQERGIRQGCPLSPCLFLIVMMVISSSAPDHGFNASDHELCMKMYIC